MDNNITNEILNSIASSNVTNSRELPPVFFLRQKNGIEVTLSNGDKVIYFHNQERDS